jgi:hypothetical protein
MLSFLFDDTMPESDLIPENVTEFQSDAVNNFIRIALIQPPPAKVWLNFALVCVTGDVPPSLSY